jgi:hypothetical protein
MTISRTILALITAILAASFTLPASAQRGLQITAKQLETMRTEKRVALVIGNARYKTQPLRNPVNDARAMSKKLRSLGFDVIERINVDKKRMQASIIDFGKKLADGGVGVFYFAGHGIQNRNRNFILPVDAQMQDEDYLRVEGVNVDEVLFEMGDAGNRLNVLILDACRNNPYRSRTRGARSGGLAQMHAPTGTYISYAAAPGEVAFDGKGEHSPYTGALLDVIGQPGVKLEDAFKRVRTKVHGVTGGRQVPFTEETVLGDFYFKVPDENSVTSSRASGRQADEDRLWNAVHDSKQAEVFEVFLSQFPSGVRAPLARSRLERLRRQQTAALTSTPKPELLIDELDATYVAIKNANIRDEPSALSKQMGRLAIDEAVSVTGKVKGKNWYRVAHAGKSHFVFAPLLMASGKGEIAAWNKIKQSNKRDEFEAFILAFPDGAFVSRASRLLSALPAPRPASKLLQTKLIPPVSRVPRSNQPRPALHIGSWRSEQGANRAWTQLRRVYHSVFTNMRHEVSRLNMGRGKGVFFRLIVGPFATNAAAQRACRQLKRRRQYCEPAFMKGGVAR